MAVHPSILRWFKQLTFVVLTAFLLVFLVLFAGTIYIVQNPHFLDHYKSDIQEILAKFSVELDYKSFFFQPLRKIEIRDLNLHWDNGKGTQLSLQSPLLRIQYQGRKLLNKHLLIEEFLFEQVKVSIAIEQLPEPAPQIEAPEKGPFSLEQLKEVLSKPPITLEIKKLKIDSSRIQVKLTDPNLKGFINFSQFSLDQTFYWDTQKLLGNSHVTLKHAVNENMSFLLGEKEQMQSISLNPNLDLKLNFDVQPQTVIRDGKLDLSDLHGELEQQINLNDVEFSDKLSGINLNISALSNYVNISPKAQILYLRQALKLKEMASSILRKKIPNLSMNSQFHFPPDLQNLEGDIDLSLSGFKLFHWLFELENEAQSLLLKHNMDLDIHLDLANYLKEAKILEQLGRLQLNIQGQHQLSHMWDDGFAINFEKIQDQEAASDVLLTLKQIPLRQRKLLFRLAGPMVLKLNHHYKNQLLEQNIDIKINKFKINPLRRPVNLSIIGKQKVPLNLSYADNVLDLFVNREKVFWISQRIENFDQLFFLDQKVSLELDPDMERYLKELKPLQQMGRNRIVSLLKLKLKHDHKSLLEKDSLKLHKNHVTIDHKLALSQKRPPDKKYPLGIRFLKPIEIITKATLLDNQANLDILGKIPHLSINSIARTKNFSFKIKTKPFTKLFSKDNQLNIPQSGQARIQLRNDAVYLTKKFESFQENLKDISLSFLARIQNNNRVSIRDFLLKVGPKFMIFQLESEANIKPMRFKAEGQIDMKMPVSKLQNYPLKSQGSLKLPFEFFFDESKQLALKSSLNFQNISLMNPDFVLKNLNGTVKIEELVKLESDNKFHFTNLISKNPFQRVDFNAIRPYLLENSNVNFRSFRWRNFELGPFLGQMSLEQNLLNLPYFSLGMFGGDLIGELLVDTYPNHLKIGILARFTNIDPAKMVTVGKAAQQKYEASKISGSVNFVFDIRKRLLEGRLSITEIGSQQLLRLIDVLDPDFEDEDLNSLRQLLSIGYPERVIVKMQEGLMDIGVDVIVAGVSKHQDIFAVPLSPMIESNVGELIAKILEEYAKVYPIPSKK